MRNFTPKNSIEVPAKAVSIKAEMSPARRSRRYLKVHHDNIVHIDGCRHKATSKLHDAMITALGLVAATQLSVIILRVLTL